MGSPAARPRCWACSVGRPVRAAREAASARLRAAFPAQARRWALCARSRGLRSLLAGPRDPGGRPAGPFPPLASPRGRRRGGAGPQAGGRAGGGARPGWGWVLGVPRGWGEGAGAESRGWGHRRRLRAADREGRVRGGGSARTSPAGEQRRPRGPGPGLSGLRGRRRGPHLPAVAGVCADCCRHRPGCHLLLPLGRRRRLLLFLLLLGRADPLPAAASSWAGPAASRPLAEPLPPPPPPPHSSSCTIGGTGTKMSNRVVCREASHAGSWYTASGRAPGRPPPPPPRLAPRPAGRGRRPCPARREGPGRGLLRPRTAWGGGGPQAGLAASPPGGIAPGSPARPPSRSPQSWARGRVADPAARAVPRGRARGRNVRPVLPDPSPPPPGGRRAPRPSPACRPSASSRGRVAAPARPPAAEAREFPERRRPPLRPAAGGSVPFPPAGGERQVPPPASAQPS